MNELPLDKIKEIKNNNQNEIFNILLNRINYVMVYKILLLSILLLPFFYLSSTCHLTPSPTLTHFKMTRHIFKYCELNQSPLASTFRILLYIRVYRKIHHLLVPRPSPKSSSFAQETPKGNAKDIN